MIKLSRYYLLAVGVIIGMSGCTQPQTITVPSHTSNPQPSISMSLPKEPIKEEILINNNPDLGERISVPTNHPTLGVKAGGESEEPVVDRLNGEVMERMAFPVDEYNSLQKTGRSTVSGKVYLVNSNTEDAVLGRKLKLYLNPVTSYSRQWYNESYLGGYKMSPVDPRLNSYLKLTYSDDNGDFDFFGVAPGNYYLITNMMCGQECGLNSSQTIRIVEEIRVGNGVSRVELTKRVP